MIVLKRFLRFLFTIYAAVFFCSTFLFVVPCYFFIFNFFPKKLAPHVAHGISQKWAKIVYLLLFIKVRVLNKRVIDPKQTYVFISNHLSLLDIPLFALACKNTFRFLSKEELTKIPVLGYIIKNLYITVNRGDKNDRSLSLKKMQQSLEEGVSVFLCPEGTRNQTKELLLPFKDGAFRLAILSKKPLAVLTIFNSQKLLIPSRWFELSPGVINAAWITPFETANLNESDVDALKSAVRKKMLEAFAEFNTI